MTDVYTVIRKTLIPLRNLHKLDITIIPFIRQAAPQGYGGEIIPAFLPYLEKGTQHM